MGSKEKALAELETLMVEFDLAPSAVGRAICRDPSLVTRLRDPEKDVSSRTLDSVWRYILKTRGQLDLDLDLE